jgi:hypothetical protein
LQLHRRVLNFEAHYLLNAIKILESLVIVASFF